MTIIKAGLLATLVAAIIAVSFGGQVVSAQTAHRDSIADLIRESEKEGGAENAGKKPSGEEKFASDPRAKDPHYEQARQLMLAIDAVLKDTAQQRAEAKKLPPRDDFFVPPLFTETREDRENHIRNLLDSALGIVTDAPIVDIQNRIETHHKNIGELEDQIVAMKEKQLTAPKDAMLPGVLTDTVDSLAAEISDAEKRIEANRAAIVTAKAEIRGALTKAGVKLEKDQVDLLLDSVLSDDLIRLVAVFNSAKLIDGQLAQRMNAAGENMNAARKYFAMHAALFAMLVHAQTSTIEKIDTRYMPKLEAILKDIKSARVKTKRLLKGANRPDQRRALEANLKSQDVAQEAAVGYRKYLRQQREQIARARSRATHDLRIADNTFETVEASFQLRVLMKESAASFEAIQKLEAPTFDQIFRNEELRREFENLTRRLDAPTS